MVLKTNECRAEKFPEQYLVHAHHDFPVVAVVILSILFAASVLLANFN